MIISYSNNFSVVDGFSIQGTKFGRVGSHVLANSIKILFVLVKSAKKPFFSDCEPNILDFYTLYSSIPYIEQADIIDSVKGIFIPDDNIISKFIISCANILLLRNKI